eukprot:scaffold26962_cov114-Isochrysis_galbana.AAC.5
MMTRYGTPLVSGMESPCARRHRLHLLIQESREYLCVLGQAGVLDQGARNRVWRSARCRTLGRAWEDQGPAR